MAAGLRSPAGTGGSFKPGARGTGTGLWVAKTGGTGSVRFESTVRPVVTGTGAAESTFVRAFVQVRLFSNEFQ